MIEINNWFAVYCKILTEYCKVPFAVLALQPALYGQTLSMKLSRLYRQALITLIDTSQLTSFVCAHRKILLHFRNKKHNRYASTIRYRTT
jgi:hypothetical protein